MLSMQEGNNVWSLFTTELGLSSRPIPMVSKLATNEESFSNRSDMDVRFYITSEGSRTFLPFEILV